MVAKGRWCRQRKSKIRGYRLAKPYDNILIGCDPRDGMTRKLADSFDVYINVSDSPCNTFDPSHPGQAMHWYPVNECGRWNVSYLYWIKHVLDFYYPTGKQIYLHCHAGAYRSPSAAILWLQSRGLTPSKARKIVGERSPAIYRIWDSNGNIPKKKNEIFKVMRKHPTWSLAGVLHKIDDYDLFNHEFLSGHSRKMHLLYHYLRFYYGPKWFIKDKWYKFKSWTKRLGYYTRGCGTYYYTRRDFWAWPENAVPLNPDETMVTGRHYSISQKTFVKNRDKVKR